MATATFTGTITIGGVQMPANISRTGAGAEAHEVEMSAGVAGTLSTRTDDDSGVITLPTGHGFTTGDILAVFWTDGNSVPRVMYGFAATVDVNAITIEPSVSDYVGVSPDATVLPVATTDVVVSKKVISNAAVNRADVTFLGADCDQKAIGVFGAAAEIYKAHIAVPFAPVLWDKAASSTSPLSADLTTVACYNGGVVAAKFQYGFLLKT